MIMPAMRRTIGGVGAGRGAGEGPVPDKKKGAGKKGVGFRSVRLAAAVGLALIGSAWGASADTLRAGVRAFARHDYVRAAGLLAAPAESGSPTALTYLGYMRQYGLGVPRDYVIAAELLHQAAMQGEPTAQFLLGLLFDKGFGVPKDWVEAEVWLNLAAAHAETRQREYWIRVRDAVAQKLTLDQLAEAQWRASVWRPVYPAATISARY